MSAIRDGDFEEAQAFALVAIYDLLFEHLTGTLYPHPPRDRGEAVAVNGLAAVGEEARPSS